jgi:hypothetical protein
MHFSPGLVPGAPRNVHPGTAIVKVYRAYRAFFANQDSARSMACLRHFHCQRGKSCCTSAKII